jgi:hypothetical protein
MASVAIHLMDCVALNANSVSVMHKEDGRVSNATITIHLHSPDCTALSCPGVLLRCYPAHRSQKHVRFASALTTHNKCWLAVWYLP